MHASTARWLARLALPAALVGAVSIGVDPAAARDHDDKVEVDLDDGKLEVKGTNGADRIALRVRAAKPAFIEIDVHDDGSADFKVKRDKVERIEIEGKNGDDRIRIDDAEVPLNETIPTRIDGDWGSDTLIGGRGVERFEGGPGKDFVDGNRGNDRGDMGAGDDTFQWDPGDGNDTIEGRAGRDVMLFNGAAINDTVDVSANHGRVKFFRDPGAVTMDLDDVEAIRFKALAGTDNVNVGDLSGTDMKDIENDLAGAPGAAAGDGAADRIVVTGTPGHDRVTAAGDGARTTVGGLPATVTILNGEPTDSLVLKTLGGDDAVDATGLPAGAPALTTDLGAGSDRMLGSGAKDIVLGGDGDDFTDPNKGDDVGAMGAGDDTFQWDPGDGNDTIEGQAGTRDQMLFNGAAINDTVDVSANGGRVKFFRDPGAVTMDLDDVENIRFNALAGTDVINVGDLSGTDMKIIDNDLATDGAADRVVATGTPGSDSVTVAGDAAKTTVSGLPATVNVLGGEPLDSLVINTLGGNDSVDATGLLAGAPALTTDLGAGNDRMLGSGAKDTVLGGDGEDFADPNKGDDLGLMGAGDDTFQWDPGDGNDTIEGQAGTRDQLLFNGANVAENIDISANGARVKFFRDVANVLMDLDDVEDILFNALGGPDKIVVGDLSGTDMKRVKSDLAGTLGGNAGDGQADQVVANGTAAADAMKVTGANGSVNLAGLPALVAIANVEGALDSLVVNGGGGTDTLDQSELAPGTIGLTFNQ
jgi:Ca2+-binding RTX toxin-like protein